jgi:YjbE family integral membrane protein
MTFNAEFIARFLSITILDLTLAGDNAVVIGMAVRSLPQKQQRLGIFWGAFGAIALRVAVTFIAAQILLIPFLQFAGGVLLLWIAWKLMQNPPGSGEGEHVRAAAGLFEAVKIIILADFIMSTDNMLAVAAASKGSFFLLMFGLGLSIPIIMFCSAMVARLMNKWPWLVILGAAILGWVSGEMIVADKLINPYLEPLGKLIHYAIPVGLAALITVFGILKDRAGKAKIRPAEPPEMAEAEP